MALKLLPPERGGRPRAAQPLRARGARRVGAQPSEHRHRLRDRQRRRRRLHRDGARRGRDARRCRSRAAWRSTRRSATRRRSARRSRRRTPRASCTATSSPQRDREAGRPGQGAGLRPGQAGGRRRASTPRRRRERRADESAVASWRHGRVHVAGAGGGQAARRAQRHLLVRRRALRDADRPAAVRGRQRSAGAERDPARHAAAGSVASEGAARGARAHPGQGAREGRRVPLPARRGRRGRPEARPARGARRARRSGQPAVSQGRRAAWVAGCWLAALALVALVRPRVIDHGGARRCSSGCSRPSRARTARRACRPTAAWWRSSTTRSDTPQVWVKPAGRGRSRADHVG